MSHLNTAYKLGANRAMQEFDKNPHMFAAKAPEDLQRKLRAEKSLYAMAPGAAAMPGEYRGWAGVVGAGRTGKSRDLMYQTARAYEDRTPRIINDRFAEAMSWLKRPPYGEAIPIDVPDLDDSRVRFGPETPLSEAQSARRGVRNAIGNSTEVDALAQRIPGQSMKEQGARLMRDPGPTREALTRGRFLRGGAADALSRAQGVTTVKERAAALMKRLRGVR